MAMRMNRRKRCRRSWAYVSCGPKRRSPPTGPIQLALFERPFAVQDEEALRFGDDPVAPPAQPARHGLGGRPGEDPGLVEPCVEARRRRSVDLGKALKELAYPGDAAKQVAATPFRLGVGGVAAMVQPAVVDLAEGRVHTYRGRRLWGAALAGYLRNKSLLYLPDPG